MKLLFLPRGGYFFDSGKQAYWFLPPFPPSPIRADLVFPPLILWHIIRTSQLDESVVTILNSTEPKVDKLFDISIASNAAFVSYKSSDDKLQIRCNDPVHFSRS